MIEAATSLVEAAQASGATTRLLGGIGVALRCRSAREDAALTRSYSDIDVVTTRDSRPGLSQTLESLGYAPEHRFNAMHGHSRMLFDHPDGTHVDVFVDQFVMCHRLDLSCRLAHHETTLSLADLLLTKLQIAELTEKDVTDAGALLLDHELTGDEEGINTDYVARLLSRDWGWWRTVSHNLRALPSHLMQRLPVGARAQVAARAQQLLDVIDATPKSLRWKARAKAGDRIPWREDPEESQ